MNVLSLFRQKRVLSFLGQSAFVFSLLLIAYFFYQNMMNALSQRGLTPSFHFLWQTAGFDIGETLLEFSRQHSYGKAFLVGLLNTLMVSGLGIIFTTLLGFTIGVGRLSSNWLINRLAALYINIFRNIPLLLLRPFKREVRQIA